jgi:hypothetical protein
VKKVNLSLSTICRRIGGEEVQFQSFLTLTMDGGESTVVNFTPRPIYIQEIKTLPIGKKAGWTPELVWTVLEKEKISSHCRHLIPDLEAP